MKFGLRIFYIQNVHAGQILILGEGERESSVGSSDKHNDI